MCKKKAKLTKIITTITLLATSGLFLSGCGCKETTVPVVDQITIWGLWDNEEVYSKIIYEYKRSHPNVKDIAYKKFPCNEAECYDYLKEVVQGLAAGNGPDIFMVNNTWVPSQKDKMLPLDNVNDILTKQGKPKIMTLRDFGENFVPVAKKDLVSKDSDGQEKIYGVPLWIDTLAVFYNRDLFNMAGLTPPPKNWTWQQTQSQSANFESYASKMTSIDQYGNITRAGAAIGYGANVHRAPDILAALMMQMGSPVVNPDWEAVFNSRIASSDGTTFSPGEAALAFFTKFSDKSQTSYTWGKEQWQSIDDFTRGHAGMMINYSNQIKNIQYKVPNLNFGIAPLPQIQENSKPVNFASYWVMAVSKQAMSSDQKAVECWNFLQYLSDKDQSDIYAKETGRVSPRIDLIAKQKEDPWLGVFADQAVSADSYPEANNARIGKIFEDAINSVRDKGVTPSEAISIAAQQVSQEGYDLSKKTKGLD